MENSEYQWVDVTEIRTKIEIDPFELCIFAGLYQDKPMVNVDK